MYTVSTGTDIKEFDTREQAIEAAKQITLELKQASTVIDPHQRERLAYANGELDSYTYETRTKGGGGERGDRGDRGDR
jgi:hypothetical protein